MATLLPTQTLAMLNAIRNNASTDFQDRIPQATKESLKNWAVGLKENRALYNEFVGLLVRIGKTIVSSQEYKNQLARFKKGELPFGETIQDIWVDIAQSEGVFDPTGANPLGRRLSDVSALYVSVNRKDKYVKSISRQQLIGSFTSAERLGDFISAQMTSLSSGAEYDEYLCTKELLGNYAPFYQRYNVPNVFAEGGLSSSNLTTLVKTMRKAYKDLQFMSREHNAMGVMRKSDPSNISLFINKDVMAELDVDVLASAFNMDKTTLMGKVIEVEDFGSNDNVDATDYAPFTSKGFVAVMVEDDAIQIYDQLKEMATIYNPDGLFENYFYHIWQCLYMRKFSNAVVFDTAQTLNEVKIDISGTDIAYAIGSYVIGSKTYTCRVDADEANEYLTLPLPIDGKKVWKVYQTNGVVYGTAKTGNGSKTSVAIKTNTSGELFYNASATYVGTETVVLA